MIYKEAVRIFSLAARTAFGGDGLPSVGEEPITPNEALMISYVSTSLNYDSLGFDFAGNRIPGFMSTTSYVAILSILPDGLRPGEFMISIIFPNKKNKNVLLLSMVVFDTYRF